MKYRHGDIPKNFKDMTNLEFGALKVINKSESLKNGQAAWACKCQCGRLLVVSGSSLRGGQKSCGCLNKSRLTHGMSRTKTYMIWKGLIQRCTNSNTKQYAYYGGRGITVCKEWLKFENFLLDMGVCPAEFSIERIDVNGNYTPRNCKWIPLSQQAKNRRNVVLLDGKSVVDIALETGIKYATIRYRLEHGVDINKRVGRENLITKCGITLSQKEWAIKLGLSRSTISMRIKRGLDIENVLKEHKCNS